jgi:steroid 5-alpha reductase family enzyme
MVEILSKWGWDVSFPTAVFIFCSIYIFTVVTVIWVIGLFQKNHSMMDGFYGWGYASVGWIAYIVTKPTSAVAALLLIMSSLHGARLGYYLSRRWIGYRAIGTGDARYAGFYKQLQPGYWWKSFLLVMHPQTIVIMVISLPTIYGITTKPDQVATIPVLAFVGMAIFGIGLYYEWLADGQLQAFKADKINKGRFDSEGRWIITGTPADVGADAGTGKRYLETGVWALTRHPNYFGNTTVWWGLWLTCYAFHPELWWTIAGPAFNTFMLTKVLGTAFQDKFMGDRPEYKALMSKRGGFFPRLW